MTHTSLQSLRLKYTPSLPSYLKNVHSLSFTEHSFEPLHTENQGKIRSLFPKTYGKPLLTCMEGSVAHSSHPVTVGVVLSGGQAPGGHNVITGLFDAITAFHPDSKLIGFLKGPAGILKEKWIELNKEIIDSYRNQGGFDMIASGRDKIETEEQLKTSSEVVKKLKLNGLVIIGGDDSNTNAAILTEYFTTHQIPTHVVGIPKTIDGDLKNSYVETSFGFDTACKIYSEMIGNILRDALSAKKYYHFIKLMGRSASHIALECALQTHANYVILGEEVQKEKQTLKTITQHLADFITTRADEGKNYGAVLIPEGLIEFIPEVGNLIAELNQVLSEKQLPNDMSIDQKEAHIEKSLNKESASCFSSLPKDIRHQLLLDRDPHGNVQVAKIQTEELLIQTVSKELDKRKQNGNYKGKFNAQPHYFGYEGRSAFPSNFDANYCYALGHIAAALIAQNKSGYMASIQNLAQDTSQWICKAVPFTSMLDLETRHGKLKPVIKKALVDLADTPFTYLQKHRNNWAIKDDYLYPGPIQFFGEKEVTDNCSQTLRLESSK